MCFSTKKFYSDHYLCYMYSIQQDVFWHFFCQANCPIRSLFVRKFIPLVMAAIHPEKYRFPFSFKFNRLWSWWQFSFRLSIKVFLSIQNGKEICDHDHNPCNFKGNIDLFFWVQTKQPFGYMGQIWLANRIARQI